MRIADRTTLDGFTAFAEQRNDPVDAPTPTGFARMTYAEIEADADRRRRFLANPPTVLTPVVSKLLFEVNRLIFSNASLAPGDKVHLGFQGVAGIGKSKAVQYVASTVWNQERAKHGEVVKVGNVRSPRVPVLYSTAPAVQSYKQLVGSVLRFFDARATGNAEAMTEQLLHLLRIAETEVVVIDDAHALRGRNRQSLVMADSLKALINRIPCTVVFVGTGLENSVLFGMTIGGMDDPAAQLRHRVVHLEHPLYRRPTREDPGEFAKLIRALEIPVAQALRQHEPGTLTSATNIRWMFDRTEGVTARVGKWLSAAAVAAVGNEERVTRALLEATPSPGLNST